MKNIPWRAIAIAVLVALLLCVICDKSNAQSFTQIGQYPHVVTDLDFDSSGNIYVAKQNGIVYRNADTLLSIPVWFQNEMGLVGLEVDGSNIYLHVSGLDTFQRIIRYDTITQTFDTIIEVSYHVPFGTTHRGGDVVVSDSILFCSFGYGSLQSSSQDFGDYRGKILSINLNTEEVGIIGFGLRNPYRFDVNDGNILIGDVGSTIAEEINYADYWQDTLLNYGWPCFEADSQRLNPDTLCDDYEYVWPTWYYSQSPSRSITGGAFWQDNWYYCDHFSGTGGYLDSMLSHTELINFPQYVTAMAVNPVIDRLVLSTWGGQIFVYEPDSIILSLPEIEGSVRVVRAYTDEYYRELIDIYGVIYVGMDGKMSSRPEIPGLYLRLIRDEHSIILYEWILIMPKY